MKDIIEQGTGLPLFKLLQLDDNDPTIEVDWNFLRMVITRLRILEEKLPDHIAENDIPSTLRHINLMLDKVL